MRADIYNDRFGWIGGLDYKKLIIVAFLLRVILASAYDIYVTMSDKDPLLPDSKFYSIRGRYLDLAMEGYGMESFTYELIPRDIESRNIFVSILESERGKLLNMRDEVDIYVYMVGLIYMVLGYSTIWVRLFNITLSVLSAWLLFIAARRRFSELAANIFLVIALFLPTQLIYSITMSRDQIRVFIAALIITGVTYLWIRR